MAIARNLKSQAMWRRDPRPASSSHRSSKFSDAEPKFFVVKSNDEGPKMTTNKVGGIFWIKDYPSTEIRRWPKFDSILQLATSDGSKDWQKVSEEVFERFPTWLNGRLTRTSQGVDGRAAPGGNGLLAIAAQWRNKQAATIGRESLRVEYVIL